MSGRLEHTSIHGQDCSKYLSHTFSVLTTLLHERFVDPNADASRAQMYDSNERLISIGKLSISLTGCNLNSPFVRTNNSKKKKKKSNSQVSLEPPAGRPLWDGEKSDFKKI